MQDYIPEQVEEYIPDRVQGRTEGKVNGSTIPKILISIKGTLGKTPGQCHSREERPGGLRADWGMTRRYSTSSSRWTRRSSTTGMKSLASHGGKTFDDSSLGGFMC